MKKPPYDLNFINSGFIKLYFLASVCLVLVALFSLFSPPISPARAQSSDAIAFRVISNPEHISPQRWYEENVDVKGSPQALTVDGYEAVRDGRTVYVNAANIANNLYYTNIYIISYNQQAQDKTVDVFGYLLENWKFNKNLTTAGACNLTATASCLNNSECPSGEYCLSEKARLIRDTRRLADLADIEIGLNKYRSNHSGAYPPLLSGTYVANYTFSTWPSWQKALGENLGINMPVDPINKFRDCPGFDPITCWNSTTKDFAFHQGNNYFIDQGSQAYVYKFYQQNTYQLCTMFETTYVNHITNNVYNCLGGDILVAAPVIQCGASETKANAPFASGIKITGTKFDAVTVWPIQPNDWNGWAANGWSWNAGATGLKVNQTADETVKLLTAAMTPSAINLPPFTYRVSVQYGVNMRVEKDCTLKVTCIPVCPLSSEVCLGAIDNRPNGCGGNCSVTGKKCCNENIWTPEKPLNEVCDDETVTEVSNCGNSRQITYGTKCCSTCNNINQPNCQAVAPANSQPAAGECCAGQSCYSCAAGYDWDGSTCIKCGDGIKNGRETCDDGPANTNTPCLAPYNGSCRYCNLDCQEQTVVSSTKCGNSVIDFPPENCDDGDQVDGDDCYFNCQLTCRALTENDILLENGSGDNMAYDDNNSTATAANVAGGQFLKLFSVLPTPYIWVANTNLNRVSKIRAFNGRRRDCVRESGRVFCSSVPNTWETQGSLIGIYNIDSSDPSRTAANTETGDIWIANRGGTNVTKLDINGVRKKVCDAGPENYMVRGIAIDKNGDVWLGNWGTWPPNASDMGGENGNIVRISGDDTNCDIQETIRGLDSVYGLAIDSENNIWTARFMGGAYKVNIVTKEVTYYPGTSGYGISVDIHDNVWLGGYGSPAYALAKINKVSGVMQYFQAGWQGKGLGTDEFGNVWVGVDSSLVKFNNAGTHLLTLPPPDATHVDAHGVAVDSEKNAWAIYYGQYLQNASGQWYISQTGKAVAYNNNGGFLGSYPINPATPAVAYTYSDMTGLNRGMIFRSGFWESGNFIAADGQGWGKIAYDTNIIQNTDVEVFVRVSNDGGVTWRSYAAQEWNNLAWGERVGRILRIRAILRSQARNVTPVFFSPRLVCNQD